MSDDTPDYDPADEQDWDNEEFGSMADHATEDDVVELEDEETE